MISNEIIYSSILIGSILIGFPLRNISPGINRKSSISVVRPIYEFRNAEFLYLSLIYPCKITTAGIGFLLVFGVCFWDGFYSLIAILVNIAIIKIYRRNASLISFLWCFLYLLFFRCATWFSFPQPSPLANAVQLLLTLKLVSVAIEIHDYRNNHGKETQVVSKTLGLNEEPSAFDIFCYSYCYPGMFTGPFFRYRTYYDYVNMEQKLIQNMPWQDEIFSRVKKIVVFAVLYLIAAYFFNIEYVKLDVFYENPLWYRVFYMVPIFFLGRMRFYSAWLLAECSFISLVLGAYPIYSKPRPANGPTLPIDYNKNSEEKTTKDNMLSYTFETIKNVDPYGCDFSPTVRLGMRNWNMGVQWWLANHVHRRWPNSFKQFRNIGVLTVSAYWHGIDPGYFGAFLTMVIVMLAEDLLVKVVKNNLPESLHQAYDWFNWFAKMRAFEYMYMAFALLSWQDTYRYWKSVYFWLHILSSIIIVLCTIILKFMKKKKKLVAELDKDTKKVE